ncbi:formylmethanofuran dehydrogenase subunit B [Planctomicrobium sp. SH664]|uniref:formylmethanofuran dehydrogenase subunit B n=1 Tax=Planctomicrobium sp. SH664 TaxID=3448125 RepID=UPI003F5C43D1
MTEFSHVPCPACSCLCDDLVVRVEGHDVLPVRNACSTFGSWVKKISQSRAPLAAVDGVECDLSTAISTAVPLLQQSHSPLLYGFGRSTVGDTRNALELAERLRGTIDTTASVGHGRGVLAFQQVGESTCTLGEVRQRADLILFWNADPVASHPRFFERFIDTPPGEFLPGGRTDRFVIVINAEETATDSRADLVLRTQPGRELDVVWALRQLLRDPQAPLPDSCGLESAQLSGLLERLQNCRYGVVFHGLNQINSPAEQLTIEGLSRLVMELNAVTRCCLRSLGGGRHTADQVLTWQTGFPFAINLGAGYPRYAPDEFSGPKMLARGEVDCCVLIGTESLTRFPAEALDQLDRIPTLVLSNPDEPLPFTPTIRITTAVNGLFAAGTAYRLDDVPLTLRQLVDSPYPAEGVVFDALCRQISFRPRTADHALPSLEPTA